MSPYKDFSVDQKVLLWSAIATFLVSLPVLWLGFGLTIFSIWFALAPYNLLARLMGDYVRHFLLLSTTLSYVGGLGMVLGAYWILTRGIGIVSRHGLKVQLSSEQSHKIKIACAVAVNVVLFLFMYILFPAGPESYP